MANAQLISVVDDDYSARHSLGNLLRSVGYAVRLFASAPEFWTGGDFLANDCLILDIRMPGMSGIELYNHLAAIDCEVPVIFITAHKSDDEAFVRARRPPIVAHLMKPLTEDVILSAVAVALSIRLRVL